MEDYCEPMQDPTAGLHVYLEPLSTSSDYSSSSKFSDPLCFSKTDVSLYNMQPSMTGFEAWSTTLSMIECWSKDGIETINPEQQADIITPASEDDGRGLTSSNNISPFPSTSGIITKASNPSDSTFTNPGYPPIIIQPAYPTSATKPLPSLVTKTNASNIARIGCGGIVSILSLIAVVILL